MQLNAGHTHRQIDKLVDVLLQANIYCAGKSGRQRARGRCLLDRIPGRGISTMRRCLERLNDLVLSKRADVSVDSWWLTQGLCIPRTIGQSVSKALRLKWQTSQVAHFVRAFPDPPYQEGA